MLQVVNLAVKMYLTKPAQTKLISQFVFNLAKFEQNYDQRDRARFVRAILPVPSRVSQTRYPSLPTYRDEFQLATKICLDSLKMPQTPV